MFRLADLRQRNGIGLKSDTLRSKVYEAEAERRYLRAGNDVTLAKRRLAQAMGEAGGEVGITTSLNSSLFTGCAREKGLRYDLQALELQSVAARQQRNNFV